MIAVTRKTWRKEREKERERKRKRERGSEKKGGGEEEEERSDVKRILQNMVEEIFDGGAAQRFVHWMLMQDARSPEQHATPRAPI